ncbi:MAG TPA: hypothetical protein VNH64_00495, partial [Parvularculaceae bacterium]|nr:hypothetical protein [Parvularculaceae bacterium]
IGPSIQSGDAAFREIFDELPPSGVTIIQHEAQGGTDFGEAAVEFRTDNNATLQSLLTKVQARPVERKDLGISIDDLPNWWSARDCPDAQLFKATNVRGWQEIDIANCPRTKVTDAIARWIQ